MTYNITNAYEIIYLTSGVCVTDNITNNTIYVYIYNVYI